MTIILHRAYLLVHLDLKTLRVKGAEIFSEPTPTQDSFGYRWLCVYDCAEGSYEQAYQRLLRSVASTDYLAWVRPLLKKSRARADFAKMLHPVSPQPNRRKP